MSNISVIDSLSELFIVEEFYEQLTQDDNSDIAGSHLKLAKLLRENSYEIIDVLDESELSVLYKYEESLLRVNKKLLLPYEHLLLERLCLDTH